MILLGTIGYFDYISEGSNKIFLWLTVVLIFFYEIFYSISLGPVIWIYCAEIMPEKGVAIATLTNWLSCFILIFLLPKLVTLL